MYTGQRCFKNLPEQRQALVAMEEVGLVGTPWSYTGLLRCLGHQKHHMTAALICYINMNWVNQKVHHYDLESPVCITAVNSLVVL